MTGEPAKPRKRPCASCPYRVNAPSGVWAADEYEKLPAYDAETYAQPAAVFMCHQDDEGAVCSGWLGHSDPTQLLSVRIAVFRGDLDESCFDYATDVPLFASGEAAAEHGLRDLARPGLKAEQAVEKLIRRRRLRAAD